MVFLRWDIILRETRSGTTIVALVTNVCIIQNLAGRCRHPPKNNLRPMRFLTRRPDFPDCISR